MITAIIGLLGSSASVAIIGFFYSLGNRVSKLETRQEDLPKLIEIQFEAVNHRLDRIERAMNGAIKHLH